MILVHEMTADGRHRIVAVSEDGTNSVGDWVDTRSLAVHLDVFANAGGISELPAGVFKVKEVAHQVLA